MNRFLKPFMLRFNYKDVRGIQIPFMFEFERMGENPLFLWKSKQWMERYWWSSIVIAAVYVLLISIGQRMMQNRKPFDLRKLLIVWNTVLAAFSILGTIRCFPEFYSLLLRKGSAYGVCNIECIQCVPATWAWLFALSKVPELFDTAFIVLRKQKLIFLHWFHHATVLVYTWYAYHDFTATGQWFFTMNYTVHAFMYTYYTFRAMRFKIPRSIAMAVTTLQLSQMAVGCYVNAKAYIIKHRGEYCQVSYANIRWSFFMYFVYFILFCHFFINAYFRKCRSSKKDSFTAGAKRRVEPGQNGVVKLNGLYTEKQHKE